jgi:flagellin
MQREDSQKTATFGDFTTWTTTSGAAGQFESLAQIAHMGAGESYLGYGKPAAFSFDNLGTDGGRSQAAWFYRYLMANYGQGAVDGLMHTIDNSNTPASRASIATNVQNYLFSLTGQTTYAGLTAAVQTWLTPQAAPGAFTNNSLSNTTSTAAQALNTPLTLQVGANYGETMDVTMLAGALGNLDFTAMVNVMSQDSASRSLTTLDKAIAQVSDARTKLGASENRLEHTVNRLANYEENSQSAYSRIRDTDMADGMTELTRSQILSQATLGSLKSFYQLQQEQTGSLLSGLS